MLGGVSARKFTGNANGAVRTIGRIGIKNVGAVALQDLLALPRSIFRHAESDGESLGRAQHGIGDASIAAGGVEQDLAGTQPTSASSFGDDVGRGAILNRSAGVIPLSLTQKCYTGQVAGDRIQTQQRSVPNPLDQAVAQCFAQS